MDGTTGDGRWIAVIGDRVEGFAPQDTIADAVAHAAAALDVEVPAVRWVGTECLARDGTAVLAGASAVWCAPGSPYRSLEGALAGIRWAREGRVPFLGTCAGFQHGVVEFARNVLGVGSATHAEYGPAGEEDLFIDELLCSLVGRTMRVEVVDPWLAAMYGTTTPTERYYCRFGLHPRWRDALEDAGLRVAGVDRLDGDVRVLRLAGHDFHLLTLFVPQTTSTAASPHPLVRGFVATATGAVAGAAR